MSKTAEMAKVSAKGSFHLLWGIVASTVISSVGTIFIANLLGPDNYGLYAITLTAPTLIQTFRDWGINSAAVKYSAQYNSEGNIAKIRDVFLSALLFELAFGVLLSVISFALSGFLAASFNRPSITPLIQIASIIILAGALTNVATSAYTGLEKMHLNSVMLIVQSLVKTGLIVGLVLLGLGTAGAVTGFTISGVFAGLIGIILMYTMYKALPQPVACKLELMVTIKSMLKYGLPVSVGAILSGFLTQFYSILMALYVIDNAAIGNYNVALNFVVLITFFATPVTTMLFPAFSKLDAKEDKEILKTIFQASVKYAALIIVPVAFMVIALSQPAIATIFPNHYIEAPLFLGLLSISYLYCALGNISVSNLINGQGYTSFNLKLIIVTAAIGFPLGFLLISQYGILGLIVTSLIAALPSLFIGLYFIKKHFEVSVDWGSSAKIMFSSGLTALLTYLLISQLRFSSPILLVLGVVVFVVVFVFLVVVTRTISRNDLGNIRDIAISLGPLCKPLIALLNLIEWLMKIFHNEK
jgi:O-antigen/teichoic acid export membrane protein